VDQKRRDTWLRWGLDHVLDFLKKNWKVLLAAALAAGVGVAGTRIATPEPRKCPECPECPAFAATKEACLVRIDRCLDWMYDTP